MAVPRLYAHFLVLGQGRPWEIAFLDPMAVPIFQGFGMFADENGLTNVVAIAPVLVDKDRFTSGGAMALLEIGGQNARFYPGGDVRHFTIL